MFEYFEGWKSDDVIYYAHSKRNRSATNNAAPIYNRNHKCLRQNIFDKKKKQ